MKYACEITVTEPSLIECLESEEIQSNRGSYRVESRGGVTRICITAADAIALRATLNSVAKLLIVHEKMRLLT